MNKLCDICDLNDAIRSEIALGTVYHLCTACLDVVDLARKAEAQEAQPVKPWYANDSPRWAVMLQLVVLVLAIIVFFTIVSFAL